MSYLVDTNVILRFFNLSDKRNAEVVSAMDAITSAGEDTFVCAQVFIEYWVVATRPIDVNGLELTALEADRNLGEFEKLCACLPEPSDMALRWRTLVRKYTVTGKQAHDARIAAFMIAHGITHLVTLNPSDFARYPEITTVIPAEIVSNK